MTILLSFIGFLLFIASGLFFSFEEYKNYLDLSKALFTIGVGMMAGAAFINLSMWLLRMGIHKETIH